MEENHNNLGEFLRKRFNDFDEEQGDWARPDKEVREKVLGQIGSTKKTGGLNASRLLIGLLGLALIVGGIGMIYLQKENAALKEDLQQKTKILEAIQQQLPMATINAEKESENVLLEKNQKGEGGLAETMTSQSSQTVPDQDNTSSDIKNKNTFNKSQELSNRIAKTTLIPFSDQQKSEQFANVTPGENANLTKDSVSSQLSLSEQNNSNTATTLVESTTFTKAQEGLTIPSLSVNSFPKELLKEPGVQLIASSLTQPIQQQRARFEVGYAFSLIRFNLEKEVKFYRRTGRGDRVSSQRELLKANGIHLAYSPAKNWWMETGLNYATADLEDPYTVPVRYNRLRDFTRPDGSRGNLMELESNNSFASEKSTLELTIPAGAPIDDGEFLNLTITESQTLRNIQIPLGIVYQQASGRQLNWLLKGGMLWNHLEFDNYQLAVAVESRRGSLDVNTDSTPRDKKTQQFLSAYLGMGLNYQLYKQWQLNAAVNYQHHFINNLSVSQAGNTTASANAVERGTAFQLALNYRF